MMIVNYLSEFEILKKMQKVQKLSNEKFEKVIYFCAENSEYKFLKPHEFLFKEGDSADYFYIVLKGFLNLSKFKIIEKRLTLLEYIEHLVYLNKIKEHSRAQKIANLNFDKVPFLPEHLQVIEEINFEKYLWDRINNSRVNELSNLIEIFNNKHKNINDYVKIDKKYYDLLELTRKIHYMNDIINKLNNTLDDKSYRFVFQNLSFNLKIYNDEIFGNLASGKSFGELAFDKVSQKRTLNASSKYESHLIMFKEDIYREYLYHETCLKREKEISFCQTNFIPKLKQVNYESVIFNQFMQKNLLRGEMLFNKDDVPNDIILISEGDIELEINIDQCGLRNLINSLAIIVNEKEIDKKEKILQLNKSKIKLFIFSRGKSLGLEEQMLGINHFFDARVVSLNCQVFAISKTKLQQIITTIPEVTNILEKKSQENLKLFYNRLVVIYKGLKENQRINTKIEKKYSISSISSREIIYNQSKNNLFLLEDKPNKFHTERSLDKKFLPRIHKDNEKNKFSNHNRNLTSTESLKNSKSNLLKKTHVKIKSEIPGSSCENRNHNLRAILFNNKSQDSKIGNFNKIHSIKSKAEIKRETMILSQVTGGTVFKQKIRNFPGNLNVH